MTVLCGATEYLYNHNNTVIAITQFIFMTSWLYVCMYVCMYVCIYKYIYIYIYIYL